MQTGSRASPEFSLTVGSEPFLRKVNVCKQHGGFFFVHHVTCETQARSVYIGRHAFDFFSAVCTMQDHHGRYEEAHLICAWLLDGCPIALF